MSDTWDGENRRKGMDTRVFLEAQEKLFDLKLKAVTDMLAVHNRTLFGDGSEGYPGLYKEVDRIKESRKNWKIILGAISVPVFADIGMKLWAALKMMFKVNPGG